MGRRLNDHRIPAIIFACLLSLLALAEDPPASAPDREFGGNGPEATITVPAGDVAALIAAIDTANSNGEADTIVLGGGTYTFTAPDNYWYGPNALPAISSVITIEGNGSILERSSSAGSNFRLFYVDGGLSGMTAGTLTLKNLTIRNGYAKGGDAQNGGGGLGAGGAIFNQGSLVLDQVTLTGNTAHGGNISPGGLLGGGGMGEDAQFVQGGGFGGPFPGASGGGPGYSYGRGGGGGGGFVAWGEDTSSANGGAGGGLSGLGGKGGDGYDAAGGAYGDGGGGGGDWSQGTNGSGGHGGGFGYGGLIGTGGSRGGGGGGGIGGGGGPHSNFGGGGGGFGGGGGWGMSDYGAIRGGGGGFGAGGGCQKGLGGFGGANGEHNPGAYSCQGGPGGGMGGAVFTMYGTVQVMNSTVSGNSAQGGTGGVTGPGSGMGGGLFNLDGAVTLTGSTVTSNSASTSGTALYNLAYANTPSGGAATATMTLTASFATDVVNNQDTSRNPSDTASLVLTMDGSLPTNILPNGITTINGASQTGSAAAACTTHTYVDAAGACGGQSPCYTWIRHGLAMACDTGSVSVSAGTYSDSLTMNRNQTVNLDGDVDIAGSVTQNSGTLNAPSGIWTVRGDFLLNGGTLQPNGGAVAFDGSGNQSVGGSGAVSLHHVLLGDGCWGYWKFDEGAGASAADSSTHGRTGTLSGAPAWSTAVAPTLIPNAGSLSFDGSDDSVTILGGLSPNAYTLSAWVRPADTADRDILVRTDAAGPMSQWSEQIRISGGRFQHFLRDGDLRTVTGTTAIVPGIWYHVAAVATPGGSMVLYVNGEPEGTPLTVGTPQGGLDRYLIGAASNGFGPFSGLIDDVRIFDRALSAADILNFFNGGMEARWKFDESAGASSFEDATAHGHTGSCSGSSCPSAGQAGVFGTALLFDGADDEVDVPHGNALDFGAAQDFSVSLWVKTGGTQAYSSLASNKSSYYSSAQTGWIVCVNDAATSFRADAWDGSNRYLVDCSAPVNDGQWHHLAAIFDRDGYLRLYQDGMPLGSVSIAGMGSVTTSQPITFGRLPDGGYPYSGMMDDVRIYKRALTAADVSALAAGRSPVGTLKTVTLGQPLNAAGTVTLRDATLDVGTGNQDVSVGGDWVLDGGSFSPGSGMAAFTGSGVQRITGDSFFENLTVGSSSVLTTAHDVLLKGTLTNLGWTDETKAITGTGSKTWDLAAIATDVTTQGSLSSLRVKRRDQNHPFAWGMLWGGKYWTITPTGSGYSVSLTLSHPGMPDPLACRYSAGRWDFGRISFTPTTVTRDGVTDFSDWAVHEGVPSPPPVGDGRNGTTAATFAKHPGAPDQIDVTYDAAHCAGQKAVILYGGIGDYTGYAGSAQCDGGDTGSTTIDGSGMSNVWLNILWENGTVAGHPGYGFDGISESARTWPSVGRCDIVSDRQDYGSCP